jgi:phosphoinositide-3-kinase regulatory subunit 4
MRVDDEIRLNRVVPYLVALLTDSCPHVRARALQSLTIVTAHVRHVPAADANIFPVRGVWVRGFDGIGWTL